MREDGIGLSGTLILADSGSEHHCDGQCGDSAHRMHDSRSSKIAIALPQSEIGTEVGKPAAAPSPVGKEGISKSAQKEGRNDKGSVLPALTACTCDNRRGRVHEHHLE